MEPAGVSACVSGASGDCELSTPGPESSIAMLPAGIEPAGLLGWIVGAFGFCRARSRSTPCGTFRKAWIFVPEGRPLNAKR